MCGRARRRSVGARGSDEVAVVSEIATPKEAEEPLLMPPTALIGFCREEAARMRFPRIELDVWSFNEEAERFYEAAGFKTYRRYMEMDV